MWTVSVGVDGCRKATLLRVEGLQFGWMLNRGGTSHRYRAVRGAQQTVRQGHVWAHGRVALWQARAKNVGV